MDIYLIKSFTLSSPDAQPLSAQQLTKEEVTYTTGNFKIFPSNEDWKIIP
jgi:hypothetical protein